MTTEVRTNGVEIERGQIEYIERRLAFALSRFGSRITKTNVYLTDNNGPKGGIDKSCQIIVRLHGVGDVIAKVVDSEWTFAFDRATSRLAHNIRRELERKRGNVRHSGVGG